MTGFRDFLTRFRPVASPGRAAPGGVPADRSAELRAELAPPLALLEQAEADAQSVRERADDAVVARLHEAQVLAEEIVAEAREEARRARELAAERSLRAAEAEATELRAEAEREAAAVRDRARSRMPALAERALALVVEDITAGPVPPPSPEAGS
ncbi:vacuolar-type H+-ATPase subunit H [Streptomyces sp. SLBN-8D4]|jgi:vacuolar-type H+-ATPase subunit H